MKNRSEHGKGELNESHYHYVWYSCISFEVAFQTETAPSSEYNWNHKMSLFTKQYVKLYSLDIWQQFKKIVVFHKRSVLQNHTEKQLLIDSLILV